MRTIFLITVLFLASIGGLMAQKTMDTLRVATSAQCGECKQRIEMALVYTKGVKSASLNLADKVATLVYNPAKTNPEALRKVISLAGYDADSLPADAKAYKNLPACCKKPDDPEAQPH